MSRVRAVKELLDAVGRAFGPRIPAPRPVAPPRPIAPPVPVPPPPMPVPVPGTVPSPGMDRQTERRKASATRSNRHCATCPKCVARDMGVSKAHVFGAVTPASKRGYDYQHFVCPWHSYVPESNLIEEWSFEGVDFDGLHPAECHLYETKHGYDGFLEQHDWSADGRPVLKPWVDAAAGNPFEAMFKQARRQARTVKPHYPDVKLTWVFSHSITKVYVYQNFLIAGLVPPIDDEVRPYGR